jgi:hypothetical protein
VAAGVAAGWVDRGTAQAVQGPDLDWAVAAVRVAQEPAVVPEPGAAAALAREEAAVAAVPACGNRAVGQAPVAEVELAVAAGQAQVGQVGQVVEVELAVGVDPERAPVVEVVSEGVVAGVV